MVFADEVKQEFLIWLYAQGSTPASRKAYLDQAAQLALKTLLSGKLVIESQGEGYDARFQMFEGYDPNNAVVLINWARGFIDCPTADDALTAVIKPPVTQFRTSFYSLRQAA